MVQRVSSPISVVLPAHGVLFIESSHASDFRMVPRRDPYHKVLYVLGGEVAYREIESENTFRVRAGSVVVVLRGKGAETTEPTLAEMINYIAQLGGHINRKNDGPPGPQTIWRGMQRMQAFATLWQAWHNGP